MPINGQFHHASILPDHRMVLCWCWLWLLLLTMTVSTNNSIGITQDHNNNNNPSFDHSNLTIDNTASFIAWADHIGTSTKSQSKTTSKHNNNAIISRQLLQQKRIVGGKPVTAQKKFPSFAFAAGAKLCGATVIHPDILLTAAHCQGAFLDSGVLIGATQLSGSDADEFLNVDIELAHPNYQTGTEQNDIMLVKLERSSNAPPLLIQYSNNASNATNIDDTTSRDDAKFNMIGFGRTFTNGTSASTLQQVQVQIVSNKDCDVALQAQGLALDENTMFCTSTKSLENTTVGSCDGDSGGPVFQANTTLQVGIISWGNGVCGDPDSPDVNVRVAAYSKWIFSSICCISNVPPNDCPTDNNCNTTTTSVPSLMPISMPSVSPVSVATTAVNQTLSNQSIAVSLSNQSVAVSLSNQSIAVSISNQSVPVSSSNQSIPVSLSNQSVPVSLLQLPSNNATNSSSNIFLVNGSNKNTTTISPSSVPSRRPSIGPGLTATTTSTNQTTTKAPISLPMQSSSTTPSTVAMNATVAMNDTVAMNATVIMNATGGIAALSPVMLLPNAFAPPAPATAVVAPSKAPVTTVAAPNTGARPVFVTLIQNAQKQQKTANNNDKAPTSNGSSTSSTNITTDNNHNNPCDRVQHTCNLRDNSGTGIKLHWSFFGYCFAYCQPSVVAGILVAASKYQCGGCP